MRFGSIVILAEFIEFEIGLTPIGKDVTEGFFAIVTGEVIFVNDYYFACDYGDCNSCGFYTSCFYDYI